ncbi:uncharacterized protein LOC110391243, partial [Numida meleagris]|uniref:uncharacterized protein LOC110391243 n=1 Tax=Numida meleagris TaxID=8996 RepID=UPI000B3DF135
MHTIACCSLHGAAHNVSAHCSSAPGAPRCTVLVARSCSALCSFLLCRHFPVVYQHPQPLLEPCTWPCTRVRIARWRMHKCEHEQPCTCTRVCTRPAALRQHEHLCMECEQLRARCKRAEVQASVQQHEQGCAVPKLSQNCPQTDPTLSPTCPQLVLKLSPCYPQVVPMLSPCHLPVVPKWPPCWLQTVPRLSPRCPQVVPKLPPCCPRTVPKLSPSYPHAVPKGSQNCPQTVPKWSTTCPHVIPQLSPTCPHAIPNLSPRCPHVASLLSPTCPQAEATLDPQGQRCPPCSWGQGPPRSPGDIPSLGDARRATDVPKSRVTRWHLDGILTAEGARRDPPQNSPFFLCVCVGGGGGKSAHFGERRTINKFTD